MSLLVQNNNKSILGSKFFCPLLMVFLFCNLSLEASPIAIWPFTKEHATEAGLDPHFVYSIAFAESTLDPFADSGKARGVMQLKKIAWNTVTDIPYAYAWDWQTNIKVGIAYLNFCKQILIKEKRFSYPLLAASYRYGPTHLKKINYDIRKIDKPSNKIYQQLLAGKIRSIKGVVYPRFYSANWN